MKKSTISGLEESADKETSRRGGTPITFGLILIVIVAVAAFYWSDNKSPLCNDGSPKYTLENTPLQFCYSEQWGEPVLRDVVAKAGKYFTLEFANTDGLIMKFQSFDFLTPISQG